MIYLLISIFCSVLVAALFKVAKGKGVAIFPIIHTNYIVAILCCYFVFDAHFYNYTIYQEYLFLYAILGILLPTLFIILNKSIQTNGIIKTDIAQRFSLIIPIIFSVFFWNQSIGLNKVIGLGLGFTAIFLILYRKNSEQSNGNYLYPLLILLGYGVVDVLFKKVALITTLPYTASLLIIFSCAFLISFIYGGFGVYKKRFTYNKQAIIWGLGLGLLNFTNIFTYIKAHKIFHENPAVVFSTMNFGVILLSTLVGFYFFKEKINKYNTFGILLSLIAIALITLF